MTPIEQFSLQAELAMVAYAKVTKGISDAAYRAAL